MEAISGTHWMNDDIGEWPRIEAFQLDMVAKGSEITIESAQFGAAAIIVLRGRNRNFKLGSIGSRLRVLGLHVHGRKSLRTAAKRWSRSHSEALPSLKQKQKKLWLCSQTSESYSPGEKETQIAEYPLIFDLVGLCPIHFKNLKIKSNL